MVKNVAAGKWRGGDKEGAKGDRGSARGDGAAHQLHRLVSVLLFTTALSHSLPTPVHDCCLFKTLL
jgi:hypothetical protein